MDFTERHVRKCWSSEFCSVWDLYAPASSFENLKDPSRFLQTETDRKHPSFFFFKGGCDFQTQNFSHVSAFPGSPDADLNFQINTFPHLRFIPLG